MSPTDRLKINTAKVSHETIDGEILIINFDSGSYYSLRGTAAEIWPMMERGAAVGEIVTAVNHRYKGDRGRMEEAINKFIAELCDEALIVHDNGHAPQRAAGTDPGVETKGDEEKPAFEAPALNKYSDMQDLLVLDPIHEVDETGWPAPKVTLNE